MKHILILLSLLFTVTLAQAKVTVHTIGDSTMADYDESTTDKRGWCQYLQSFFDPTQVTINNRGKSGADTRQFYNTLWASVKGQMTAGDYVLIQFAHNDEGTVTYGTDNLELAAYNQANGLPALTDARGTCPYSTYRDMLRLYIDEARALGVNPVLVGPICRKYFSGNTIKRNGQHDLGDKFDFLKDGVLTKNRAIPATNDSMDYVYAMQQVAQEKNVPFVNLTEGTRDLYVNLGEAVCTSTLFCNGDNTHLQAGGAMQVGRLGAQMLRDAGILSQYISIPTEMTASPAAIAVGETYAGVVQNKEILLSGAGLEPAAGTISATASPNLTLSLDGETYTSSLSLTYAGGSLFQRVKVQAAYSEGGVQQDSVVFTCGTQRLVVPVSATVVSLEGGTEVSATWAMATKATVDDVTITGPISAMMTMAHICAWDAKAEFTDGTSSTESFVRLHNADDSGTKVGWPTEEIDENVSRYIDFAITAPATAEVRITRIAMELAAHSTSAMCLHVNTGFGDDMTDVTTICEKKHMTNKQIYSEEWTPTLTIAPGETLHVRVLPWHENTSGSGKYVALRNVIIEGVALEPEAAAVESQKSEVESQKRLVNGHLLIYRNGHTYTAQGQLAQ